MNRSSAQHQSSLRSSTFRGVLLSLTLAALVPPPAAPQSSTPKEDQTYFEFGQVVAVTAKSVVVQNYDEARRTLVQHSFQLSRDSRADVVHIGDVVEVIYAPSAKEWALRRLVLLSDGRPKAGPPPEDTASTRKPSKSSANMARTAPGSTPSKATAVALPSGSSSAASVHPQTTVALGNNVQPKTAAIIAVPLGATPEEMKKANPVTAKSVARDKPSEECHRSDADWPAQPIRIAVLDFRYPTEREEAHDVGTTGGGSGTAVADLIFARLDQLPSFAWSRADRDRLYRGDFAGAARIGRQMGVDAVIAGTFAPVDAPPGEEASSGPKAYELRAGMVDTCTGQLLMKLTSAKCPGGVDLGPANPPGACTRYSVSPPQAADPKAAARSYNPALDALLFPLEHNGPPPNTEGTAGIVTAATPESVTIRIPAGFHVTPGDQLAIHTWGLTKDPSTYTLRNLHDEETGRVTVKSIHGRTVTGSFLGDIQPIPGDTVEPVTQ